MQHNKHDFSLILLLWYGVNYFYKQGTPSFLKERICSACKHTQFLLTSVQ